MIAKNHYDAVLIGLDLGTLLAAALLSKRGFRVLLIGQGQPWPSYELRGVRFPRAPFALAPHDSPTLSRILSELALKPLLQRRMRPLAPAFQVVLARHRLDVSRELEAFGRELEREFPSARRYAEELWREASQQRAELERLLERDLMWPPQGFFERREFARAALHTLLGRGEAPPALPPHHGAELFAQLLQACVGVVDPAGDQALTSRALGLLSSLLGLAELGEGGLTGLYELLLESIRTHNGSLRLAERVHGLTLRRGALERLHLLPSDEEIGCQFMLWGLPVARLGALLPDRELLAPLFEEVGEPRPVCSRFTLNLLLRAEALPEGMARNVLLLPPDLPPLPPGEGRHLPPLPPGEGRHLPPLPPGEGRHLPPLPPGEGRHLPPLPPGEGRHLPPLPPGEGRHLPPLPPGEGRGEGTSTNERALWLEAQRLPDGERALLTIEARIPMRDPEQRARQIATQRERMLEDLSVLSPFLRDHIELVDSPHDGRAIDDVQSGASLVPDPALRRGPDTMETVYAFPRARLQGSAGLAVRTPIKRILLCNSQVVPGLGQEGVFLTAWSAARAVTRSLNRDWMNRGRWTKVEL